MSGILACSSASHAASATETRMAQPLPALVVRLQDDFGRLTPIIRKYRDWNDDLSLEIKNWWLEVRKSNMQGLAVEVAHTLIKEKANKLRDRILVDCVQRNTPLMTPVLVQGWTWEKSSLERFKRYFTIFDGNPLTPEEPHTFAEEVIAWTRSVTETVSGIFQERCSAVIPYDSSQELDPRQIFIFTELVQRAIARRRERQETARMRVMDQAVDNLVVRLREQSLENRQKIQEMNRQHEEAIRRNIEGLKSQAAETVKVLEERISSTERRNQETQDIDQRTIRDLQERVKELSKQLEEALKQLALLEKQNAELTCLVSQLSARVAYAEALQRQLEDELNNQSSCVIS